MKRIKRNPKAEHLGFLILAFLEADKELKDKMIAAPRYSGQSDREDFYVDEENNWSAAAEDLYDFLKTKEKKSWWKFW